MNLSLVGALKIHRAPIKHDGTASARVCPGQYFNESRFTGPILPDQCMDFSRQNTEICINQGRHTGKALRDVLHTKQWIRLDHSNVLFLSWIHLRISAFYHKQRMVWI
jgi:hypothetical protein